MIKESYFNLSTIDRDSAKMLAELGPFMRHRGASFVPDRAALLIIDMQRYFLDPASHAGVPSAAAVRAGVLSIKSVFEANGRPVIATRHLDGADPSSPMMRWWSNRVEARDPMSALDEEIAARAHVVEKTAYDAFYESTLEETLRAQNVSQLVITGVLTHLCVETTARAAFIRGFDVFIPVNATATYNRELHVGSLRGLAHGFARVMSIDEITQSFADVAHR